MAKYREPINNLDLRMTPLDKIEYRIIGWPEAWTAATFLSKLNHWTEEDAYTWLIRGKLPNGQRSAHADNMIVRIKVSD